MDQSKEECVDRVKKSKLDISGLMLLCREQGYFDLEEIQTAVFEHNGRLSILPKSQARPATPKDFGIATAPAHIGVILIMDGRVLAQNLQRIGRDEDWLKKEIKAQIPKSPKDIFLAVYHPDRHQLALYPKA